MRLPAIVTLMALLVAPVAFPQDSLLSPGAGEVAKTLVGSTFYACKDIAFQPSDGRPFSDGEILAMDALTVKNASVSNPTRYPGARINLTLVTPRGRELTLLSFVEPANLKASDIRWAIAKDTGLRVRELAGGAHGRVEDHMSMDDVICELGRPEATNDYGHGNLQLVFDRGRLIVYMEDGRDGISRVSNVTHFESRN